MSILENLVNGLFGGDDSAAAAQPKPCTNCPADCSIYPNACDACSEYKKQLIDQLYFVDHLEEHYAKYEIAGAGTEELFVGECPYCGATDPGGNVCQYCGSVLKAGSNKIRVSGASEIPDPIQLAQDIIFRRREEIVRKYEQPESTGLLDALVSIVTGSESDSFGSRMSTDEIKTAAAGYGVSVSAYLQGLDNGSYLTASAKEKAERERTAQYAAGTATAAGAGLFAGSVFGSSQNQAQHGHGHQQPPQFGSQNSRPQQPPQFGSQNGRPQQPPQFGSQNGRPQQPPQFGGQNGRPQQQTQFGRGNDRPDQKPQSGFQSGRPQQKPQMGRDNDRLDQRTQPGPQGGHPNQKPQSGRENDRLGQKLQSSLKGGPSGKDGFGHKKGVKGDGSR